MLAESESERNKWVGVLSELHKILKKNKFRDRSVYVPKEAYDSTLPLIKTTQAAAIIGTDLPFDCVTVLPTNLPCEQSRLTARKPQCPVCPVCCPGYAGRARWVSEAAENVFSVKGNQNTSQVHFLLKKPQCWRLTYNNLFSAVWLRTSCLTS